MRETVIANVKDSELPAEWRAEAKLQPGERVDVIIRPARARDLRDMTRIAASASRAARGKGLTGRKLERLLDEAKAARRR